MKVGLLIVTYNRPLYLKQCLTSLSRADLSAINEVLIIDDCSTNPETLELLNNTQWLPNVNVWSRKHNSGIKSNLLGGYTLLFDRNDLVINLDSDAIVRHDFVNRLIEAYIPESILTGFHSTTKNANGTDRHKIIDEVGNMYRKQSVGGINFCVDKYAYDNFIMPSLNEPGNFDHHSCLRAGWVFCLKESVIEHIGYDSSMGHIEEPDTAANFYYHDLPDVTLIGVDSDHSRIKKAANKCKYLNFADTILISPQISSKEQYSTYVLKELHNHFKTSHCLIIQHDGYVLNPIEWDETWLEYDYIGGTWWYQDGMNVGNGGFSLRSHYLMKILATDPKIIQHHPEDHHICRTYRTYLEETYSIKFAPEEVADKFSYEGYRQPMKKLNGQFGFHGAKAMAQLFPGPKRKYVFNQFRGLGDILFLIPMYRALVDEGSDILWPVVPEYLGIAKHFPDVKFVNKDDYHLPYETRFQAQTDFGIMLPYRFAIENMGRTMKDCMRSKYELYGHDYRMWRELTWKRDKAAEERLKLIVGAKGEYVVVNRNMGEASRGMTVQIPVDGIEMRPIEGYTLIDWLGVIEGAKEVHTVNTSLSYLLELMPLKMPVHLYRRGLWGEAQFEHTAYLWESNKFIYH